MAYARLLIACSMELDTSITTLHTSYIPPKQTTVFLIAFAQHRFLAVPPRLLALTTALPLLLYCVSIPLDFDKLLVLMLRTYCFFWMCVLEFSVAHR